MDFCCFYSFLIFYFVLMKSKDMLKKYNGGRDVNFFVEYFKCEVMNIFEVFVEEKKKKKKKIKKDEL